MTRTFAVLALTLFVAGCGDVDEDKGSEYEPLYTASEQVTENSIYGVWSLRIEGREAGSDLRVRFAPSSVTAANRCVFSDGFSVLVGVTAAATITETEITVRESKEAKFDDGTHRCHVDTRPARTSYTIDGTRLVLPDATLIKVSD